MTSMREKIARALMMKRGGKCLVKDWTREATENPNVHRALTDADAVLDALMEPTEGMYQAGEVELGCHQIFTAMIRAAKEGK